MKKVSIKIDYDQSQILVAHLNEAISDQTNFKLNSDKAILAVVTELYLRLSKENYFKYERKKLKISVAEAFAIMHMWEMGLIYSYNTYSNSVLLMITGAIDQQTKSIH